jgi:hypothetical protein
MFRCCESAFQVSLHSRGIVGLRWFHSLLIPALHRLHLAQLRPRERHKRISRQHVRAVPRSCPMREVSLQRGPSPQGFRIPVESGGGERCLPFQEFRDSLCCGRSASGRISRCSGVGYQDAMLGGRGLVVVPAVQGLVQSNHE